MKSIENKTLVKRFTFTVLMILIFHLLGFITIPGINGKQLAKVANNQALQLLTMFSGGGLNSFSLMSMGLSGFINAQIVVQILQNGVDPKLTLWAKSGEVGRKKLDQFTRVVALIFSFVQSIGITAGINKLANNQFVMQASLWMYLVIGMLMTAGTFLGMWIADQITVKGLGNGTSVIISYGIISRLPQDLGNLVAQNTSHGHANWVPLVVAGVITLVLGFIIAWFNSSEHRTPIQYATREVLTGKQSYLPLKLIVPGVIPIIFASSIFSIPQTFLSFANSRQQATWYQVFNQFLSMNSITGMIIYCIFIVVFTYIYSSMQFDPEKVAENFTKQEAYIPGVVPGKPTAEYFKRLLNDLALPGSLFLVVISVTPMILSTFFMPDLQIGLTGSSMLILVGTFTDIRSQVQGLRLKADYKGFLDTSYDFDQEVIL